MKKVAPSLILPEIALPTYLRRGKKEASWVATTTGSNELAF